MQRQGRAHGLAGWFRAELSDDETIDTSPLSPPTHWAQAYFPYLESVEVIAGDVMEVKLRIGPQSERSDDTSLHYDFRCTQLAKER